MTERRSQQTWVAYALIALNLGAFVYEVLAGADALNPTTGQLIEAGANVPLRTLHGEPWRMFTSMWLHYGLIHIGLNMICLYQGRWIELLFGRVGFVAIYLVSGLIGGVASTVASPDGVAAGASGAVFGVFGAFGAFLWLRKGSIEQGAWQRAARQIGMFVGINLVFGLATPGISVAAHVGGLIAGFAVGALLLARTGRGVRVPGRAAAILVAGAALSFGALAVVPAPSDVRPALEEFDRVQAACLAVYDELSQGAQAGKLTDAEVATRMEREVIAPWKGVEARLAGLTNPPPRLRPLVTALREYVVARRQDWELMVVALRAPPGQVDAARTDALRARAHADLAFGTLRARLADLK